MFFVVAKRERERERVNYICESKGHFEESEAGTDEKMLHQFSSFSRNQTLYMLRSGA